MKSLTAILLTPLAALALVSCGSFSNGPRAQLAEPTYDIRQVVGPPELNYPQGPIEIRYELRIHNNSAEPLTLRRVELGSSNPEGGAYSLVRRSYSMNETVEPTGNKAVTIWAHAYGYGRGMREAEPVTVRGTLYFNTPVGYLNQIFVREIGQYPGQNDVN
jgi:hypothetical protein